MTHQPNLYRVLRHFVSAYHAYSVSMLASGSSSAVVILARSLRLAIWPVTLLVVIDRVSVAQRALSFEVSAAEIQAQRD